MTNAHALVHIGYICGVTQVLHLAMRPGGLGQLLQVFM